jgi:hypothetical protein
MQDTDLHGKIITFLQISNSSSTYFTPRDESKYLVSMDEDTWNIVIKI